MENEAGLFGGPEATFATPEFLRPEMKLTPYCLDACNTRQV